YTASYLGNYNIWKPKLYDQFSTLTDDKVSMLFCFLCSDSSPPDFTDTEWLNCLNVIRRTVYGKGNPVTREEAQQTLDRLKSSDYLWEDQGRITMNTKDETMYRIASKRPYIPFLYSSYDTVSVYLRSMGYKRKPEEKCVVSNRKYCDSLLILRLQMNILTHVTMEDTSIYDKIHHILNIPENQIKSCEDERSKFLRTLRRGEAVHYRGRPEDSVDHVRWLLGYGCRARHDIVRSCIGLQPHWDIYILDNKAYRKSSEILSYPPEVRCLLYCLLLSDQYRLNLNEQSHRIIRDKIKDRCFIDLNDDDLVDLPDGITETHKGVITFISEDIRHDVMNAFVTECLVEESDLEFFLTTASRDVISEYCRTWWYTKSRGERCLYLPDSPEKLYYLFIDKLQLDIITHCTVSDRGIHGRISRLFQPIHDLQQHIFDIASRHRWKENIPKEWSFFEIEINQKKESKRILDIENLTTKLTGNNDQKQEELKSKKDMLRYYHDAGKALYFNEEGLQQYVVIDVQWFTDAFKHIITDKLHFKDIPAAQEDWNEYYNTGNLRNELLTEIWKQEDKRFKDQLMEANNKDLYSYSKEYEFDFKVDPRYLLFHKEVLLNFMQRLGLIAVGQNSHYVPSMNRKEIESAIPKLIQRSEKTSIQLQVFHPVPGRLLGKDETYKIQNTIEIILYDISGTFHRSLLYEIGFKCQEESAWMIAVDINGQFVKGKYVNEKD
ncbi:uncharacterized protein LOC134276605, partial [Saccostrea cucullata]|uniref:uncharacterized protein LOC134276605 n=1 Tax=Saccostrea cuccullata TaxID=36930 RepID=UPI002ED6A1BA